MPRRPDLPCAGCGTLMWRGSTSSPAGVARCQPCRRKAPGYRIQNMAARGIVQRWACGRCGIECERPATRGQRPKWCALCRQTSRDWLPLEVRREVYERDGWVCQICTEPVDHNLVGTRSIWRPSLDHITPRSAGGGDEPENLRLAHSWCNSVLNDRRAYSEVNLRAS